MSPFRVLASCGRLRMAEQKYLTATGHQICAANTAAAGQLNICDISPRSRNAIRSGGPMLIKLGPNPLTNLYSVVANFH
jgi:hypothetical protein